jgi:hypothetical protein
MKIAVLASLLLVAALPVHAIDADKQPPKQSARPSDEAIRAAVRATIAERPANPRLHEADTLRANRYELFARQVEEATVPDCLHPDGLKRQPTFFFSELLALPFIAVAKIRGKCQ